MKIKNYFLVTMVCLVMALTGCFTTSFNQKSYQILKTSQTAYDLATDSVIDMHKRGLISDKDYTKIEQKADTYADAHNTAVDAIKAFNLGIMTVDQTNDKLTAVSVALTELLKITQPYILKMDKEK